MIFFLAAVCLLVVFDARADEANCGGPPFPRIGNCYGAGLGHRSWEEGGSYWSKLGLIVGGCYDLHYDWDSRDWSKALAKTESNLARLREVNPKVIVLPYVDVIEGIDHASIPAAWWDLNAEGGYRRGRPCRAPALHHAGKGVPRAAADGRHDDPLLVMARCGFCTST